MSYNDDDNSRREGYGRDERPYGGPRGRMGEAAEYYNQEERPSEESEGGRRYGNDGQAGQYDGQGAGRRYENERPSGGYDGEQGGGANYHHQGNEYQHPQGSGRHGDYTSIGGGYGGDQGSGGRHDNDSYGTSADAYGSSGGYGGGGSGYDQNEAINQARKHGNDEDGSLFSHAMSLLGQHKHDENEDLDEQQMIGAHQQLYGNQTSTRPHDSTSLGAGAAMQALKMFTGGGAGHGGLGSQGTGNSQSQFIGIAMAQAGKLFDQQSGQGNVAGGADKQSAINTAAKLAMQMYLKSEGKGGGGGPGGLMGLAGKFL